MKDAGGADAKEISKDVILFLIPWEVRINRRIWALQGMKEYDRRHGLKTTRKIRPYIKLQEYF